MIQIRATYLFESYAESAMAGICVPYDIYLTSRTYKQDQTTIKIGVYRQAIFWILVLGAIVSSDRPTWRRMFNTWEQAVSPGLEELTASPGFQDLLAIGARVNAGIASEAERMTRQWLHLWNLPAATDIRRLRQQVASLERELKVLRRQAGQAATSGPGRAATSSNGGPVTTAAADAG